MNKRIVSALLAGIMLVSSAACGAVTTPDSVTAASSSSEKYAEWLDERLGDGDTTEIVVGTADDAAALGVDVSSLRDEGYTIRKSGNSAVIVGKTADGLDRGVRYYAKNIASLDSATYTYGEGYAVKKLTIAGNDIADYTIVLPKTSDECHEYAATELRDYIANACGASLPIVAYGTAVEGHTITLERVMKGSDDYAEFGDESFLIAVDEDGDLLIKGGYYRGCLYGVYEFLESYVGYRFLFNNLDYTSRYADQADGNIVRLYEADAIDVPAGTYDMQLPSFSYRSTHFSGVSASYLACRKVNSTDEPLKGHHPGFTAAKYGSNYGVLVKACHGIDLNILGSGYDFDGYDPTGNEQPCFSDESFVEYSIERFTAKIQAKIDAGGEIGKDITNIDVSQRDSDEFCVCKECMKQNRRDGGYVGSVLTYTNAVAEALEERFGSELKVGMLAYWGTSSVPKETRPRDNVVISYCFYNDLSKNACNSHCIDGKSCTGTRGSTEKLLSNSLYAEELEGWCEIMGDDSIIIWYYPGTWDWGSFASPIALRFREDMAYLASLDQVCGIFFDSGTSLSTPADLAMAYLIQNLIWDAEISEDDYRAMILDYFTALLGAESAECIVAYMDAIDDISYDCCWTVMAWTDPSERIDIAQAIESFPYFLELYDRAIAAAENEYAERYISRLYCGMLHMELTFVHDPWYLNGDDESRARYTELYNEFRDLGNEYGYQFSEVALKGTGKVYDIEDNPSNLFDYNKASDGDDEWWLG